MIYLYSRGRSPLAWALAVLLVGCDDSSTAPEAVPGECAEDGNLLQNPGFEATGVDALPAHWHAVQHAGERAYTISLRQGELSIVKVGQQHWMVVRQSVDPEPLAGKPAIFSAQMRQSMTAEGWTQTLEPGGGLSVVIHGTEPQAPRRKKLLFSSNLQHKPKLGEFDWTPVQVAFSVPAGATRVEVGFLHQANGDMAVRNPSLCIAKGAGAASDY